MKKMLLLVLILFGEMPAARAQFTAPPPAPITGNPEGLLNGCPLPGCSEFPLGPPQAKAPSCFCEKMGTSKKKCCQTPLGQFINTLMAPLRLVSGGVLGDCCPAVLSLEELAQMTPGTVSLAEAAAAKIKAEETGAKHRRAAVRYLGTVVCHFYPEAEAGLIAGLRADRNETVRLEAALSLGKGCCCTMRTVAALHLVVAGSDQDGNPAETSERVKAAAMLALNHCQARGVELSPADFPETLPPLSRRQTAPANLQLTSFLPLSERRPKGMASGTLAERTFAETFGAPPRMPPPAERVSSLRALGLTPIGAIPEQ